MRQIKSAMNNNKIWISPPHLSGKEIEYIKDALEKNWITTMGDNVTGFEGDVEAFMGENTKALALNSGTSALHLSLILSGVDKEDIVLCQNMTFAATVNPVFYLGAEPILIGSESESWNISPLHLENAIKDYINKGKKPKAIVWVNLYGMPAMIDEITTIARKYEIPLLEDAAESLGSTYDGHQCGTFGDLSVISFNGNKIITTSGGGMLLSSKQELIDRARYLSGQARDNTPWYQHSAIGYNYGMSNIIAGLGRGQMEVLPERIEKRRAINAYYRKALADLQGITFQTEPSPRFRSNFWLTAILIDPALSGGADRETLRLALQEANIESRPTWKPMHTQPAFKDCVYYGDSTDEMLFDQGLCLPSGSDLNEEDLQRIVKVIREVCRS